MRWLAAGLLLELCSLHAKPAGAATKYGPTKVFGFTQDGESFVYMETYAGSSSWGPRIRVMNVKTWESRDYNVRRPLDDAPPPDAQDLKRQELEQSHFDAWHKQHPAHCAGGTKSPDGKLELMVAMSGSQLVVQPQPSGGLKISTYGEFRSLADGSLRVDFYLHKTAGAFIDDTYLRRWNGRGTYGMSLSITPCWSPDGKRLAVLAERDAGYFSDPGDRELILLPIAGEGVVLRSLHPHSAAVKAATLALEQAGFVVLRVALNKKPPAETTLRISARRAEGDLPEKLTKILGVAVQVSPEKDRAEPDLALDLAEPAAPAAAPANASPPPAARMPLVPAATSDKLGQ